MRFINRITHLKEKLLFTALFAVFLLVWTGLSLPCVYRKIFHIYCPGCGMTHAYIALLHLRLGEAFKYNFMFWSVPVCWLYILFDGKLFRRPLVDNTILGVIAAGYIILFVIRLFGYLSI